MKIKFTEYTTNRLYSAMYTALFLTTIIVGRYFFEKNNKKNTCIGTCDEKLIKNYIIRVYYRGITNSEKRLYLTLRNIKIN